MYHRQRNNYREYAIKEIVGTSVLTRYNNRTYRIDDIAWDKTPKFKFSRNGEEISLIDYYKTYCGIEIKDLEQPLLVNRATQRTSTGEVCGITILHVDVQLCYFIYFICH